MMEKSMRLKNLLQGAAILCVLLTLFACNDAAEQAGDPNTPRGALAVSGDTEVILTWAPVQGAEKYIVCWAYVEIKDCSDTNPRVIYKDGVGEPDGNGRIVWKHTGITNNTAYHYVIVAYAASWGNSPITVNIDGAPLGEGIDPPAKISISASGNIATITWQAVEGATQYHVYMASQPNVNKVNYLGLDNGMIHDFSASERSFQHPPLTLGLTYYFVVTAVRDLGNSVLVESLESQQITVIPKVSNSADVGYLPADFTVSRGNSAIQADGSLKEFVTFDWSNPCPMYANSNIFSVYWATTPFSVKPAVCDNTANCVSDLTTDTSNQVLDYLEPGTDYYFSIITAYNNFCIEGSPGTNLLETIETQLSPNISIQTINTPTNALVITAAPLDNAVLINIDNLGLQDPSLKYNLYMAANSFCTGLTTTNYKDDTVWGMVHTNFPKNGFKHVGLPRGIPFCFIATSVNELGVENQASGVVLATPLEPAPL